MLNQPAGYKTLTVASLFVLCFSVSIRQSLAQVPDLGIGASLHGAHVFPADDAWNTDVSQMPVDPNSSNLLASIGLATGLHPDFGAPYNGVPNGIPYIIVPGTQPSVPVTFQYADESDPGPYPIPTNAPVEGGLASTGDRHVLVVNRDTWRLYELYSAYPNAGYTAWSAGSGAVFNLNSSSPRPQGWTSADAAGLPIFPGLVRYDEVFEQGAINHALRFTVQQSRHGFIYPARHAASSLTGSNLPPMGMRVRLKASFNISGFPMSIQIILTALKKYGMIVADNGSNWYMSGAPDNRWNDSDLHTLGQVHGSDFEVIQMRPVITDTMAVPTGLQANPAAGSVALTWTASPNATSYLVKRATNTGGPYTTIGSGAATSFTDSTVSLGPTYYYVVSAVNAGQQSFDSAERSATLQASQATITSLTLNPTTVSSGGASTATINLSGPAPTGGALVSVTYSAPIASGPGSVTIPAGASGATFAISMGSVNASTIVTITAAYNGGTKSTALTVTPAVPAAPSGLTAAAVSGSQINLAWTNTAANQTGFAIERSGNGTSFTQIATVSGNVTSYWNTGLARQTTYYYRIRAFNGTGSSAPSNVASAKTNRR